ncbi:MAG: caspase family protein [Acidobacteria bacterium]|nr:caspase family protein [Acidobacteriota bacterium]
MDHRPQPETGPAAADLRRRLPRPAFDDAARLVALALAAAMAFAAAAAAAAPLAAQPASSTAAAAAAAAPTQYALIVNGDDSFTHNYNVSLALASLRQLGYAPQNTLILAPASVVSPAVSGEPAAWRRPATEQGLRQALALLRERLRPGDLLLVYLTGHGYRMFGRTSLGLQDGSITARELMQKLGEIAFGKLILIADQCYSGGFVNAAVALGRDVVAVSSTDDRHEVRCEPFIRPLWLAAVEAASDTRRNGFVSIEEAFQVAVDGLRQAGGGSDGGAPQIATSGSCAGRENRFAAAPPGEHADQQAVQALLLP